MGTLPLTPGIYRQPLAPVRSPGRLARGDVPALLGYTRRGPVGAPVRIYSMEQFEQVFGAAPAHGHLWPATKGFFENGGQSAYVIRVATDRAHAASLSLPASGPVRWQVAASFPWSMIDPRRLAGSERLEAAGWLAVFGEQLRRSGPRSEDPGIWGNTVGLRIRRTSAARSRTIPDTLDRGAVSRVTTLASISRYSVLQLTQLADSGERLQAYALPAAVDPARSLIHWESEASVLPCRLDREMRIASVDFSFEFTRDAVATQRFEALAVHPLHPNSILRVLTGQCRDAGLRAIPRQLIAGNWVETADEAAAGALAGIDWRNELTWPAEGQWQLAGGTDGLEQVAAAHWVEALEEVARLEDAALLCCPDLVLGGTASQAIVQALPHPVDCADLGERPTAMLSGIVNGIEADGRSQPLAGVQVQVAGTDRRTSTGANGQFTLGGVPDSVMLLRLRHRDYTPLDVPAQGTPFTSTPLLELAMSRLTLPRVLDPDQIREVQRVMLDSGVVGPYKVALLDPPTPEATIQQLVAWRDRLGEAPRGFFSVPWLVLAGADGQAQCPPSGHVAGAFAAAELAAGIHYPAANRTLRHLQAVTLDIDEVIQQELNPVGINPVRSFEGRGLRLHGARSLSFDPQWRFITVRRLIDAIEKSLLRLLEPVVFEPHNELLWHCASTTIESFLARLHREGMLAGASQAAAFAVRCDEQVNPQPSRDAGKLVIEVAVAPTVPYEFITFRIGHAFDALSITEEA
ncbi:phage tail sheath subtilisin-like domain-containing protein [Glutamicibacter sp. MNS18]|uniref:phage tail sheath C-terminal domain-containing protein n=1 Tax=Glutamicibacter sp. MNS18 TaxID=2989817 RepID=UPI0022368247|nr:phage tail sheath C-terminal domain-containing protein [Glutamicibacter sp. MNS18]MCW4464566.1 phage tail sheath subtilisin-like domain-containing protein [Glutamicibacter sp. MNS18]